MSQIVHMKKTIEGENGRTVPLCTPSAVRAVSSYNWPSVNCKKCLGLRKHKPRAARAIANGRHQ